MKNVMDYKGYFGSVNFSEEDMVFHGKLEFIRDLVTYEADDAKGIVKEFHEAVDDYLEMCGAQGKEPNVPFKGMFNVRVQPDLHRRAVLYATRKGKSLNRLVGEALEARMEWGDSPRDSE